MRRQRRSTIIVVGGALAIASVGYGLGTQAGDGTAIADNTSTEQDGGAPERHGPPLPGFERGAPPGIDSLADKLGVDSDELATALRDYHDQHDADRREEFAAALAKALGISTEKAQSALDEMHLAHGHRFRDRDRDFADHEARFAARLARALGADPSKVKAALEDLRSDGPVGFGEFASKLADELGEDVSDVRAALMKIRPPGPDRMHRRPDMPLRQLANALGVSRADLRAAFRELRNGAEEHFKEERQALAEFLADRFDLDVSEVQDALTAVAPPLMSPHPPGPRDHPTAL